MRTSVVSKPRSEPTRLSEVAQSRISRGLSPARAANPVSMPKSMPARVVNMPKNPAPMAKPMPKSMQARVVNMPKRMAEPTRLSEVAQSRISRGLSPASSVSKAKKALRK